MTALYVREQGASIRKVSQRIRVEKDKKILLELPVWEVSNLGIIGNVQISTQAVQMLLQEGIDVNYFSYSGECMGQITSEKSKNIFLRLAQYELFHDSERNFEFARAIVRNKVMNQITTIKRFRWGNSEFDYGKVIKEMLSCLATLKRKKTVDGARGVEGKCSMLYFSAFSHMLKSNVKFETRNRRPPKDPINVILSLGYTFLTKEVESVLALHSFEMYIGFLHGIRYGRKSLALDLVEEFRQPVIDRLVLRLFNKRILNEYDFETQEGRVVLLEEGFRKFCSEYEQWMQRPIDDNSWCSFRKIIQNQVAKLKHSLMNGGVYTPYEWGRAYVLD